MLAQFALTASGGPFECNAANLSGRRINTSETRDHYNYSPRCNKFDISDIGLQFHCSDSKIDFLKPSERAERAIDALAHYHKPTEQTGGSTGDSGPPGGPTGGQQWANIFFLRLQDPAPRSRIPPTWDAMARREMLGILWKYFFRVAKQNLIKSAFR